MNNYRRTGNTAKSVERHISEIEISYKRAIVTLAEDFFESEITDKSLAELKFQLSQLTDELNKIRSLAIGETCKIEEFEFTRID